jgi:cell division protein FtsI/penicillin-binding protein 2
MAAVASRTIRCASVAWLLLSTLAAHPQQLFSQAAAQALDRAFPDPGISWLLLDNHDNTLAERWPDAQRPVSPGSLVKPFLAVAWGQQHDGAFPRVHCLGTRSRCWLPAGHGTLGLEEAIAQSCNAWFLALAASLDRPRAARTFASFGLAGPALAAPQDSLIGFGTEWQETPAALAAAYLHLIDDPHQPPWRGRILTGMLASADHGTARSIDAALGPRSALAKTGTAPCSHTPRAAADGYTLVAWPAQQPRLLLLVRVHGVTGAQSSAVGAQMLRLLGAGSS